MHKVQTEYRQTGAGVRPDGNRSDKEAPGNTETRYTREFRGDWTQLRHVRAGQAVPKVGH